MPLIAELSIALNDRFHTMHPRAWGNPWFGRQYAAIPSPLQADAPGGVWFEHHERGVRTVTLNGSSPVLWT